MEWASEIIRWLTDPEYIILYGGLALIWAIIFAENGVFFALLLPGESLVFLTGVFCQMGLLPHSLPFTMLAIYTAAFGGHQFGYYFGMRSGRWLFRHKDSYLVKRKHLALARAYYRKYGVWTILIGRYIPVVRTLAPILAGSFAMKHHTFTFYNLISTTFWVIPFLLLGYFAGAVVPNPQRYLPLVFIGLAVIVLVPLIKPLIPKTWINFFQQRTEETKD
ncbi:DedA family protein [Rhodoflexus sp.]